jgi:hypothetical protein
MPNPGPAYQFQPSAGQTVPDLETFVRDLTFQQSTDQGLFSPAKLDRFINNAHRYVYGKIVEMDPTWFAQRSPDTAITSTGVNLAGTVFDPNTVFDELMVELKVDQTNYRMLQPIPYQEKDKWEGTTWRIDGTWSVYRWTHLGQTILLYPSPATIQTIRITYTPGCSTLVNPTDQPFAIGTAGPAIGTLAQYHEMVGWLAAALLKEPDEDAAWMQGRYDKLEKNLIAHVRKRQSQNSRRVIESALYDW